MIQNSFTGNRLLARAGRGFLVIGGVSVTQPTGEGEGRSIGRFVVGALTPAFALDPTFGGPAMAQRLAISVPRQRRARAARTTHGIRVGIDASAVGLARVKVFHGDRAIAQSVLPVFKTGPQSLPVELTHYGNRYLSGHRNLRVTVRATSRDLVTATAAATATARGRLR